MSERTNKIKLEKWNEKMEKKLFDWPVDPKKQTRAISPMKN